MISHFVPAGKTLYIATGDYTFHGPQHVQLSGPKIKLPETYTDGTPIERADNLDDGNTLGEILSFPQPTEEDFHSAFSDDDFDEDTPDEDLNDGADDDGGGGEFDTVITEE